MRNSVSYIFQHHCIPWLVNDSHLNHQEKLETLLSPLVGIQFVCGGFLAPNCSRLHFFKFISRLFFHSFPRGNIAILIRTSNFYSLCRKSMRMNNRTHSRNPTNGISTTFTTIPQTLHRTTQTIITINMPTRPSQMRHPRRTTTNRTSIYRYRRR